jgi:hypothetical protein
LLLSNVLKEFKSFVFCYVKSCKQNKLDDKKHGLKGSYFSKKVGKDKVNFRNGAQKVIKKYEIASF